MPNFFFSPFFCHNLRRGNDALAIVFAVIPDTLCKKKRGLSHLGINANKKEGNFFAMAREMSSGDFKVENLRFSLI